MYTHIRLIAEYKSKQDEHAYVYTGPNITDKDKKAFL